MWVLVGIVEGSLNCSIQRGLHETEVLGRHIVHTISMNILQVLEKGFLQFDFL